MSWYKAPVRTSWLLAPIRFAISVAKLPTVIECWKVPGATSLSRLRSSLFVLDSSNIVTVDTKPKVFSITNIRG